MEDGKKYYAKQWEDQYSCTAAFGMPESVSGEFNPFAFTPSYFICGKGATSTKKGEECTSASDCPSSESGINARCECVPGEGLMRCGVLNMDEEYTEYIEKFKEYYEATTDCHSSRDMDAICQERDLLFAYMCEMKEA